MGRRTFLAGAIAGLLLLFAPGAAAATYTDPQGDAQAGAADITRLDVSNDVDGNITFELTFANRTALGPGDTIHIFLNSDNDSTTGQFGLDYVIVVQATGADLLRASPPSFAPAPHPTLTSANGGRTIRINRDDLGESRGFTFFVQVLVDRNVGDEAPDTAAFLYTLALKPVLDSLAARFSPARPKAGKLFRVASTSLRLDDGNDVRAERITCIARVNGKRLAGRCSWRIPANARGKRLVVTITARYRGASATFEPWRFRVG